MPNRGRGPEHPRFRRECTLMTDATGTQNLFSEATALWKQSRKREALDLLGSAIRHGNLGPEECHNAGRLIGRIGLGETGTPVRALLLGQCTTSWIAKSLTAVAWGRGS